MPYRVCKDEGDTIILPVDTKVYANPGMAAEMALKSAGKNPVLYACDSIYTYRWHGALRTNKDTVFTKVNT